MMSISRNRMSLISVARVSNTTASLQIVVNPPLRRGTRIHDRVFEALRDLQPDYARFVPWLPYPRLAVAELEPPHDGQTFWDFSLIDPLTIDFLEATKGHPSVLNFSTTPQWMWVTPKPVTYPANADQHRTGAARRINDRADAPEIKGAILPRFRIVRPQQIEQAGQLVEKGPDLRLVPGPGK